ncbi:MAG: RagB/SusD family nutrient uptake outer membrane protein [Balneolaceae bacterium]
MNRLIKSIPIIFTILLLFSACDLFQGMDVQNDNSPNLDQVFADSQEYPSLLSGAYNTWWNEGMGPNPNFALSAMAEIITSGYGSWGMGDYYKIPRQPVINENADDIVLNPVYGVWYSYYSGLTTVNNIIRQISQNGEKVIIGDTDYTQEVLAHAYFLQGLFIGHLGLVYDKAFLITEDTDINTFDYEFTPYKELIDFALNRMDKAIEICNTNTFSDPNEMMPNVKFDNTSLARFINSNAARILAESARNESETASLDWNRVLEYAKNGIQEDFSVYGKNGWTGLAISRDPYNLINLSAWDWVRVNQRLLHMMCPDDPGATYPWPDGKKTLPEIQNCPDLRLQTDMEYAGAHPNWNPQSRGYQILSNYKYSRFYDTFGKNGIGNLYFYLEAENDLYEAEAIVRTTGPSGYAADLINKTRVDRGGLQALTGTESKQELLNAVFYERYIELGWTYPLLGWYDRRRNNDLMEGSAKQLPVPAKELGLHNYEIYTFGG